MYDQERDVKFHIPARLSPSKEEVGSSSTTVPVYIGLHEYQFQNNSEGFKDR